MKPNMTTTTTVIYVGICRRPISDMLKVTQMRRTLLKKEVRRKATEKEGMSWPVDRSVKCARACLLFGRGKLLLMNGYHLVAERRRFVRATSMRR